MQKWTCDQRGPGKECRSPHGCHCREIEALQVENGRLKSALAKIAHTRDTKINGPAGMKLANIARRALSH